MHKEVSRNVKHSNYFSECSRLTCKLIIKQVTKRTNVVTILECCTDFDLFAFYQHSRCKSGNGHSSPIKFGVQEMHEKLPVVFVRLDPKLEYADKF